MPHICQFELNNEIWDVEPPVQCDNPRYREDIVYPFATVLMLARLSQGDTNSIQPSFELDLRDDKHRAAFLGAVFGKLGFVVEKADVASKPAFS